ncbi:hypothetical protein HaLaN_15082 [Haematococcus lacustris]|uniref:Uncharacterized protein n=1 Tax=Haematococcus lacustris TaxID=44745 RepID=A0A699Z6Q5_HAELA|nr:hypothetical protein HaLaN_15082 [Haematococcus lacustris]
MHLPVRFPVQPLRRIRALAAPEHDPLRRIQSDAVKVPPVACIMSCAPRRSSKQQGALPKKAAPVDAAEASRGAIDYVQLGVWSARAVRRLASSALGEAVAARTPSRPPCQRREQQGRHGGAGSNWAV